MEANHIQKIKPKINKQVDLYTGSLLLHPNSDQCPRITPWSPSLILDNIQPKVNTTFFGLALYQGEDCFSYKQCEENYRNLVPRVIVFYLNSSNHRVRIVKTMFLYTFKKIFLAVFKKCFSFDFTVNFIMKETIFRNE